MDCTGCDKQIKVGDPFVAEFKNDNGDAENVWPFGRTAYDTWTGGAWHLDCARAGLSGLEG